MPVVGIQPRSVACILPADEKSRLAAAKCLRIHDLKVARSRCGRGASQGRPLVAITEQQLQGAGPKDSESRRILLKPNEWKSVYATLALELPETGSPRLHCYPCRQTANSSRTNRSDASSIRGCRHFSGVIQVRVSGSTLSDSRGSIVMAERGRDLGTDSPRVESRDGEPGKNLFSKITQPALVRPGATR